MLKLRLVCSMHLSQERPANDELDAMARDESLTRAVSLASRSNLSSKERAGAITTLLQTLTVNLPGSPLSERGSQRRDNCAPNLHRPMHDVKLKLVLCSYYVALVRGAQMLGTDSIRQRRARRSSSIATSSTLCYSSASKRHCTAAAFTFSSGGLAYTMQRS